MTDASQDEIEGETTISSNSILEYFENEENLYNSTRNDRNTNEDWLSREYEYLWKYVKWMIYGYNFTVDLEKLEADISFNHSAFGILFP